MYIAVQYSSPPSGLLGLTSHDAPAGPNLAHYHAVQQRFQGESAIRGTILATGNPGDVFASFGLDPPDYPSDTTITNLGG